MKRNASAILLLVSLFLLVVALNFVFFIDQRATGEEDELTADRSSYRATPYGTLALYSLLEESHYNVTRFEKRFTELKDREPGTLLVIAPPETHNPDQEEFEAVTKWVEAGGLLIIVDRQIDVSIGDAAIHTEQPGLKSNVHTMQPTLLTRGVEHVALSEYASRVNVDSRSVTYHIGDDQAVLADTPVGKGRVVLLTDPYVVANNGISQADNVVLALNLLAARPAGTIAFDEYHHGYGASTTGGGLLSYFRGTPVPWMLAQIGLIAALVVYSRGRRFGRPLPLKRERRTTNLEFVSSMANITRLAHATDLAMENIYGEFRKRLCRFGGVPAKVENERLAASVARRARLDERELVTLLNRCEGVSQGEHVSESELLKLVARIREIEALLGS